MSGPVFTQKQKFLKSATSSGLGQQLSSGRNKKPAEHCPPVPIFARTNTD
jgi:hypothetical protein